MIQITYQSCPPTHNLFTYDKMKSPTKKWNRTISKVKSRLFWEYFVLDQTILKKRHKIGSTFLCCYFMSHVCLRCLILPGVIIRSVFNVSFEVIIFNLFLKSLSTFHKCLRCQICSTNSKTSSCKRRTCLKQFFAKNWTLICGDKFI